MRIGILFSGGKDSTYAAYLARKNGHSIKCLITLESENKESFMFHTPSINCTEVQALALRVPIISVKTSGEKEKELVDLENAIKLAVVDYGIQGIVTGAVGSVYQASRVQKICNKLGIECFNPLWQKDQLELLEDLIKEKFEIIIVGVFAFPLDKKWLGRKIDKEFILDVKKLSSKFGINPAGEGGEFESLVVDCPLFSHKLNVERFEDFGEGNSFRREVKLK